MEKSEMILEKFRLLYNKKKFLDKEVMQQSFGDMTASEVHCVEYIGKHQDVNVTQLANYFFMTKGAMSKIIKKLYNKNLIYTYQNKQNKKEIYFLLTDKGREIMLLHDEFHHKFFERDRIVFDKISNEEWTIIDNFVQKYIDHLDGIIKIK